MLEGAFPFPSLFCLCFFPSLFTFFFFLRFPPFFLCTGADICNLPNTQGILLQPHLHRPYPNLPEISETHPCPSFPFSCRLPFFSLRKMCFSERFAFFSRNFRDSAGIKNPLFLMVCLGFSKKRGQGRKPRTWWKPSESGVKQKMPITSFDGPLLGFKKSRSRGKDEKLRQEKAKMRKKTKHWNVKTPTPFSGSFFTIKLENFEILTFFWPTDWGYGQKNLGLKTPDGIHWPLGFKGDTERTKIANANRSDFPLQVKSQGISAERAQLSLGIPRSKWQWRWKFVPLNRNDSLFKANFKGGLDPWGIGFAKPGRHFLPPLWVIKLVFKGFGENFGQTPLCRNVSEVFLM